MTDFLPSGMSRSWLGQASDQWLLERLHNQASSLMRELAELREAFSENADGRLAVSGLVRPHRVVHLQESPPLTLVSMSAVIEELCRRGLVIAPESQ